MLAVIGLLNAAATASWAQEARFTQQVTPAEQTEAGLTRLSSDQLAALDALIRIDEKVYAAPDAARLPASRFSQRISFAERKSAGLDLLTDAELARIDLLVGQYESRNLPAQGSSSASRAVPPEFGGPAPEIHGMISFTYGAGRGGYREMGGGAILSFDDPSHGFSVLVGYEEMQGRGPLLDRGHAGRCVLAPLAPAAGANPPTAH